jgi:hypothetical protein
MYVAIPGIPNNFTLQTGNQQNYLLWSISPGATSYTVQRSTDGVNFTTLASPVTFSYLDTTPLIGVQYWYQIASVNLSGTSGFTNPLSVIPAPTAEMSLSQLRYTSQEKADRVNSNFVTLPEWNTFINLALYELYDILVTVYEDYFLAPLAQFQTNGSTYFYPLPDGSTTFINSVSGQSYIAPPFYKLVGIDLGLSSANNAWVTLDKFNLNDRNQFVYPNTASTIYGVFNLRYRVLGNQVEFIPTPSANQPMRYWYIPRLPQLLQETDLTTIGTSGWLQYVIVRAAKYALDKEESDTMKLDQELMMLKSRIEESAANRDAGKPDTITNIRLNGQWGSMSGGYGSGGPIGGY